MRGHRRATLVAGMCAVALALADGAEAMAATVHVETAGVDNAGCGGAGSPCRSVGYALANRVTPEPDTVALGPGTFSGPGISVVNPNASGDTVTGTGSQGLPAGTVLQHNNAGANALLTVSVPVTIRALSINVPAGAAAARNALELSAGAAGTRVDDVAVTVGNASSAAALVRATGAGGAAFTRLRITGNHVNDGLRITDVPGATVDDATLQGGTAPAANALSLSSARGVVVRRSRLSRDHAAAGFDAVVDAVASSLTIDSSLITGGRIGIASQSVPPGNDADLTVRGVTIDIATAGVVDPGPDRYSLYVRSTMPGAATSSARVEHAILVEPIYTFVEAGSTISADCSDSLVSPQDAASPGCGPGGGNSAVALGSLFADAAAGDYHPLPASAAVDGNGAALGAGESDRDLDGGPRLLDGNADCVARVDRGAYELGGHAADPASCPTVPPPADAAPVLDHVRMSPATFRTRGSRRGTRLRLRLSEAARVTMTVERVGAGRKQGTACRKPSRANRRRPRCERRTSAGTRAFTATTGEHTYRFSGRTSRGTLAPGRYRARLVARDSGGRRSSERVLRFTVKR